MRRGKNWIGLLLLVPGILFVAVFMLIPLFTLLFSTFTGDTGFSFEAYIKLFQ